MKWIKFEKALQPCFTMAKQRNLIVGWQSSHVQFDSGEIPNFTSIFTYDEIRVSCFPRMNEYVHRRAEKFRNK